MAAPGGAKPTSVAFACDYNALRSPMAEGLAKWLCGRHVFVQSAGVRSGNSLDPFAVEVTAELGIDISHHRPRSFDEMESYGEDFASYDVIVAFTPAAQLRALEYTRHASLDVAYWPTADPSVVEGSREQRLEAYRAMRDAILGRVRDLFEIR